MRRRIRWYVWAQGLASMIALAGVLFWLSLAADWFFEPTILVRKLLLGAGALAVAAAIHRTIVRRAWVPLPDASLALLLERRFPQFDDSLVTAVELTDRLPDANDCQRAMLSVTCHTAAAAIEDVRPGEVFNTRPLRLAILVAVLFLLTLFSFRLAAPQAFGVWQRRCVWLSEEIWPRKTRLAVDGFTDGVAKVARGADFPLIAKADLEADWVPPSVRVTYRPEGGDRLDTTMIREGRAVAGRERYQHYAHTFRGVLNPIDLELRGGDATIKNLRLEVVDAPILVRIEVECRYPAYMLRAPRVLPVAGMVSIPRGTEITLLAEANKPLLEVLIDDDEKTQTIRHMQSEERLRFEGFRYHLQPFEQDKTLLLGLLDADGIRNREPIRLTFSVVADQPPQLSVPLQGIGSAITPDARLPFLGRVTDDYGVDRVWLEYVVEGLEMRQKTLLEVAAVATEVPIDDALDVRDLGLSAGQKMLVTVKACDRYDLEGQPNVGSGDRWMLDVVTPEQLRAMLEAREIVLRQRFETIIEDVEGIRETLTRFLVDDRSDRAADAVAEPGEAKPDDLPARQGAIRLLRVQRARANGQKDTHETLGVAEAFSDIRRELVNNRIYTEELRIRIEQGIVLPLEDLGGVQFPDLDNRLALLEKGVNNSEEAPVLRDDALRHTDRILRSMRDVLSRMVELEDFNEAVQLLRSIISEQESLRQSTLERRKEKLRQLLEN